MHLFRHLAPKFGPLDYLLILWNGSIHFERLNWQSLFSVVHKFPHFFICISFRIRFLKLSKKGISIAKFLHKPYHFCNVNLVEVWRTSMDDIELGFALDCGINRLNNDRISDNITRDNINDRLHICVHVLHESRPDAKSDPTQCRQSVGPPHKWVFITANDYWGPHYRDWNFWLSLLKDPFRHRFWIGICIGIIPDELLFLLFHFLRSKSDNFGDNLLGVRNLRQIVDFLFNEVISALIRICVCCAHVRERFNVLAVFSKLQHSQTSKVVNLDCV